MAEATVTDAGASTPASFARYSRIDTLRDGMAGSIVLWNSCNGPMLRRLVLPEDAADWHEDGTFTHFLMLEDDPEHHVGSSSGPAISTHAGAGEERQRRTREALEDLAEVDADEVCDPLLGQAQIDAFHEWATGAGIDRFLPMAMAIIEEDGPDLPTAVACVYDAAVRVMAGADPLPLASSEPWVEGDEAYRARLVQPHTKAIWADCVADDLDTLGDRRGLPRARLVLAESWSVHG